MSEPQGLLPVEEWQQLMKAWEKGGVPAPFVTDIFLLNSEVVGMNHVKDIEAKTAAIVPGAILAFQREPHNKYDARAIGVLNGAGERIGYVPRKDNAVISRLMDAGKLLFGKVKTKKSDDNWMTLDIGIYMRDL